MADQCAFIEKLEAAQVANGSMVCVGLDPDPARIGGGAGSDRARILSFLKDITDATADLVCAFKPQIAHFAALGAERELETLIQHIHQAHPKVPVILDAKRGDIGSTAERYAIEAFDRYGADAVTANPYLGGDSLAPFLCRADRGVIILCRTSNPGGADLQDLEIDGRPLFERVARSAADDWNNHGNVMLVVGATWPEQLARVREIVGDMPLLVPGVGAQGGDATSVVRAGRNDAGWGLVVNSSRGVLYAGEGKSQIPAARLAAAALRDQLREAQNS